MKKRTLEEFEVAHGQTKIARMERQLEVERAKVSALSDVQGKVRKVISKGNTFVFGLFGDTQTGSMYSAPECWNAWAEHAKARGATALYHTGDVLDGHRIYKGQEFELREVGMERQLERLVKDAPDVGIPVEFIVGNHDLSLKHLAGVNIGKAIEERMLKAGRKWKFLGEETGYVEVMTPIGKIFRLRLLHPGGGSSYAISYRLQKIIESLEGGTKPDMLCFPKGTRITMANGTEKDISEIVVGDHVVTHTGESKLVSETFKRDGTDGYNISVYGRTSETVKCTKEHPFWAMRDGVQQWIKAEDLLKSDWIASPILKGDENIEINFVDYLSKHFYRIEGDCLIGQNGKSYPAKIKVDENFARLLGLYVAEGYNDPAMYRMCFAFNQSEEEYNKFVSKMFLDAFHKGVSIEDRKDSQTRVIKISDMMFTDLFATMVGHGASNKSLPDWCLRLPVNIQKALLQGMFEGDGCKSDIYYELSTTSGKLVHQVMLIAARVGLAAGYSCQTRRGDGRKPEYTVRVHHNGNLGDKWFNEGIVNQSPVNKLIVNDGNYIWHHVRFIEPVTFNEPVYNIEVEDEHSYIANGLCAHNCVGHYHKAEMLPNYRNVCGVQTGCFSPHSTVLTPEGAVPFHSLVEGQMVMTHGNRYRPIQKVLKRKYEGNWTKLRFGRKSTGELFSSTANHPVLCLRKNTEEPVFIEAEKVNKGDVVFVPTAKCSVCGCDIPYWAKMCSSCNSMDHEHVRELACLNRTGLPIGVIESSHGKNPNWQMQKHLINDIVPECRKLQENGWLIIPTTGIVMPDAVGVKDGKVVLFEFENSHYAELQRKQMKYDQAYWLDEFPHEVRWIDTSPRVNRVGQAKTISGPDGFIGVEVIDVETKYMTNRMVYNLEVEEDHTYVCQNLIVHNCFQWQSPFMARMGLAAHVGGWIIEVTTGADLISIRGEFVAFFR